MAEELFFPTTAAKMLGVSPPTLRRYAQTWEKAIGPLPRAPGGGRLWPSTVLARLATARELAQREGLPLEEALLRVGELPPPPLVATARPEEENQALLRRLVVEEENQALLREVVARMEALEEEIQDLKKAIETLKKAQAPKRPWWRFWG
jgi:DNA-binding transcriptional MerR regulator